MSDTDSILSRTSGASSSGWSSSTSLSTSSTSSSSSRRTRSSGRGGVGNIKFSSNECLTIDETAEHDDDVSTVNGREAPAAKPDSTCSTGRSGAGNIISTTIMRRASRVTKPGDHTLTAALVAAQEETHARYERMLVIESREAARHTRHTYGRGGAGNSASLTKPKVPKPPKIAKTRSKSRLINYGSLRASRGNAVKLDTPIPEEPESVEATITISKKDLGKMRKAFAKSLLVLRTASAATASNPAAPSIAPQTTPPSSTVNISSPSSPESASDSISTSASTSPSSVLITSSGDIVQDATAGRDAATKADDGDPGVIMFPPDEDTLSDQLVALQLRKSWNPRAKRATLPWMGSDAESISCADLEWMEEEWPEETGSDSEDVDEENYEDEEDDIVKVDDGDELGPLNLNEVMYALLEEAKRVQAM
ncbi:hypothetical protein EVJ58_g1662 [Rhodofomes roseus]|uniref:Uncharacterized protein n=1 Tax=Rhodofomes roseus TaxID=34475 RepID=A0A4Y9YYE3_9APHY|nr:hypothetical protein EVJ58_g1662 [Rhodofomes roseus]